MKRNVKAILAKITNNKGYSMVESILVFAIASTLSAITLPSILLCLDSARELKSVLEARYAYMAAQQVTLLNYAEIDFTAWPASGDLTKVAEIANCPEENIKAIEFDTYGNINRFIYDNGSHQATFISTEGWTAEKTNSNATVTTINQPLQ